MARGHHAFKGDINGTTDFQALCENGRATYIEDADYFGILAAALATRLANELRRRGVDSRGILGSDANRAAKRITRHLSYIAELNTTAARAFTAAWRDYNRYFLDPIQQAANAREEFKV